MKKFLLSLASLALVVPAYALVGEGTNGKPFKITKLDDFAEMETLPVGSYYILENDIDGEGVIYVTPFQKYGEIYFDGNYHVIKNIKCYSANAGLFGIIDGEIKNLGIESCEFDCLVASSGWGPSGVFAAYMGATAPSTIDNCYSLDCVVKGSYAAGIAGGTKAGVTITNCYSTSACTANSFAGGILGAINYGINSLEGHEIVANISNCFAAGDVKGEKDSVTTGMCGGIVGGNQNYNHPATGKEIANLDNVVVWCPYISGASADVFACTTASPALEVNLENAYCWEFLMVNKEEVEDGKTSDELDEIVKGWTAFTIDDEYDMPVLKWQVESPSTGVAAIAVDDNAPAEYYNLQGVRVANPDNGIYIVRRGAKVTKELVR